MTFIPQILRFHCSTPPLLAIATSRRCLLAKPRLTKSGASKLSRRDFYPDTGRFPFRKPRTIGCLRLRHGEVRAKIYYWRENSCNFQRSHDLFQRRRIPFTTSATNLILGKTQPKSRFSWVGGPKPCSSCLNLASSILSPVSESKSS